MMGAVRGEGAVVSEIKKVGHVTHRTWRVTGCEGEDEGGSHSESDFWLEQPGGGGGSASHCAGAPRRGKCLNEQFRLGNTDFELFHLGRDEATRSKKMKLCPVYWAK